MAESQAVDGEGEGGYTLNNGGKNETLSLIFSDLQLLDCYICCEPLSVPVFQCQNGHAACSSCCTKVNNKCPSCSLAIGDIRCRVIEKFLESVKIPCRNSKYGCKMIRNFNEKNNHESLCLYEPCSCPFPDCFFIGSSEQLCTHFGQKHGTSATSFSHNSRFTICLNPGDGCYILQAENGGFLFFLTHTVEIFGDAVTLSRIGPSSSERKFRYEIKAKTKGSNLCLESTAREFEAQNEISPSKGSLLIPNDFFGPSSQMMLEFRIWPAN